MAGKVSIIPRGVLVLIEWKAIRPARSSAVLKVAGNQIDTIYGESTAYQHICFPATYDERRGRP